MRLEDRSIAIADGRCGLTDVEKLHIEDETSVARNCPVGST